jgi:hypothetical protein
MRIICNVRIAVLYASLLAIGLPARGSSVQLGNMQADKIVYLGNSITSCGPNGWGLSASTPEKDYVHQLAYRLDAATGGSLSTTLDYTSTTWWYYGDPLPDIGGNVAHISDLFECNFNTWNNVRIQPQLDWGADIAVVQFGENLKNGTMGQLEAALKSMLNALRDSSNPHIFVTSHILGTNATVDAIKKRVCAEDPAHRVFVDLTGIQSVPGNIGDYGHPSDAGMAAIADTLFDALAAHAVPEPSSIVSASIALAGVVWYGWRKKRRVCLPHAVCRRIDVA